MLPQATVLATEPWCLLLDQPKVILSGDILDRWCKQWPPVSMLRPLRFKLLRAADGRNGILLRKLPPKWLKALVHCHLGIFSPMGNLSLANGCLTLVGVATARRAPTYGRATRDNAGEGKRPPWLTSRLAGSCGPTAR